ncbi:hypothetical protein N7522_006266 [Penicillium canescens]|nr:hypothetical protein N7522_006266 [Penicillium canescens]
MSQNQQSLFSSSIYGSEFDNYTPRNHPFTPDLSESQETLPSFDTDFLQLSLPPTLPSPFTRVGPGRNKAYFLYDEMLHNDWVANSSDGAAKVMCKRCGQLLEHPNFVRETKDGKKQRQGTSTMKGHLTSAGCIRASQDQGTNITRFLQPKV